MTVDRQPQPPNSTGPDAAEAPCASKRQRKCRFIAPQLALPLLCGGRPPCGPSEPGACGQEGEGKASRDDKGFLPFGQVGPQALRFRNWSCCHNYLSFCKVGFTDTFHESVAVDK